MITRGHFIGQIIDELSDISNQVETRCRLGFTDLNLYLEDFFKEVLNQVLQLSLVNLNQERTNNPGLDLGDKSKSIAFQVTSTKSSAKVNETLKAISPEDKKGYDHIHVLVIGKKQKQYTLDGGKCQELGFEENDIWDTMDLCKLIVSLRVDRLQNLFDHIQREVARVKIELEVPTEDGNYKTSVEDHFEKPQTPKIGECKAFVKDRKENDDRFEGEPDAILKDLTAFSNRLAKLPRITREFFAKILELRDEDDRRTTDRSKISDDKLRRICKWRDIDGELRLLEAAGLVDVELPEYGVMDGCVIWIFVRGEQSSYYEEFHRDFLRFVASKSLGLQKTITNIDFSDF